MANEEVVTAHVENVDGILADQTRFETMYRALDALPEKAAIVNALVEQEVPVDPQLLLDGFIPDSIQQNEEESDELVQAKRLKQKLRLNFIGKGLIDLDSDEAAVAQEELADLVENDKELENLLSSLPIEVASAITSSYYFQEQDPARDQELFQWVQSALLRKYLKDIRVHRTQRELGFAETLDIIPPMTVDKTADKLLITRRIVHRYRMNRALNWFRENEEDGFEKLVTMIAGEQSDEQRQLLESVLEECREITAIKPSEEVFNTEIFLSENQKAHFPNFRQKYFIHEFRKTNRKLLHGDTGSTKTACSYLAMEDAGAKRVLIVGPAKARLTWSDEAKKLFTHGNAGNQVVGVEEESQLLDPEQYQKLLSAQYVFISSTMMARAQSNPALLEKLQAFVLVDRPTDGVIIDESDEFRKEETKSAKTLVHILQKLEEQHSIDNSNDGKPFPMVALTATPIISSLEDLDTTMAFLFPLKYDYPTMTNGKMTFSQQCAKNPTNAFASLFGNEHIIQWTLEDIFGERVPSFKEPTQLPTQFGPYQRAIYEWVSNLDSLESLPRSGRYLM